jgi:hypothetical protein
MPATVASIRAMFPSVFDAVPDGSLEAAIAAAYLQLSPTEWGDRLDLAASYLAADQAAVIAGGQAIGGSGVGAGAVGATSYAAGPVSMSFGGGGGAGAGGASGLYGAGGGTVYARMFEALKRRTIVAIVPY